MAEETKSIVVLKEGQVVKKTRLAKPVLTIGRASDNDLILDDDRVSTHHADVRVSSDGTLLTDLGSRNGTFIDSTRLLPNRPERIQEGQSFRIASFQLVYTAGDSPSPGRRETERPVRRDPDAEAKAREAALARHAAAPPRSTAEPFLPGDGRSAYLKYLPPIFHENTFLGRYLKILEAQWEPSEARQNFIAMYFDPATSPASFLPWLAEWVGVSADEDWPEPRRRRLVAEGLELYRRRGTPAGLVQMLDVCAGLSARVEDAADQPYVFKIRVTLPPGCDAARERDLSERLIQAHKPAFAGYLLDFEQL